MTLFDIAKTLVRADAAMLRANLPRESREEILKTLALGMARDGLEETNNVVPIRRPL